MKLYKVTLQGLHATNRSETNYRESYVVADDASQAYNKVRAFLDKNDMGFAHEREMDKIELLADSNRYPQCATMLFE